MRAATLEKRILSPVFGFFDGLVAANPAVASRAGGAAASEENKTVTGLPTPFHSWRVIRPDGIAPAGGFGRAGKPPGAAAVPPDGRGGGRAAVKWRRPRALT